MYIYIYLSVYLSIYLSIYLRYPSTSIPPPDTAAASLFFNCLDCLFRQNLHIQKIRLGMSKPGRGPWPWPIFLSPFKWHKSSHKNKTMSSSLWWSFFLCGSLFIFHPQLGWLYHESFYANFFARIPLSSVAAASSLTFRICCPVES